MRRDTTNYENCSALSKKNEPPVADGIKKPMKKGLKKKVRKITKQPITF